MAIRKSKELSAILGCNEDVNICEPRFSRLDYLGETEFTMRCDKARGGTMLHSPKYHLLPVDLRLPPSETLWPLLSTPSSDLDDPRPFLSSSLPTLLLFECVLVYMSPTASSALIQSFVDYFSTPNPTESSGGGGGVLGGIVYEMFGLEDSFGRVMLNNLQVCY
jgi:[phosphatase 2A protein]-leucine-carboxy methyltransferase